MRDQTPDGAGDTHLTRVRAARSANSSTKPPIVGTTCWSSTAPRVSISGSAAPDPVEPADLLSPVGDVQLDDHVFGEEVVGDFGRREHRRELRGLRIELVAPGILDDIAVVEDRSAELRRL